MRAVKDADHPDPTGSGWIRSVEKRLTDLHTALHSSGRRLLLQVADSLGRTAEFTVDAATGFAAIRSSAGGTVVAHTTTTSAANARIDPDTGALQRVTSSEAGKVDIRDVTVTPSMVTRIRGMRRRLWRDGGEVAHDPHTTHWIPGWIAEELHAAGLSAVVEYDDTGNPIAVAYDRVPVLLHAWISVLADHLDTAEAALKTQSDQIKALQDKNAEQDKQLATVTANLATVTTKLGIKL